MRYIAMNISMEFSRKFALAYAAMCKPLCQSLHLPQTAFDILMFLANNPAYQTAADIVEIRRIKANLVSVHVARLVQNGYLTREAVPGDRRKTRLLCTEKALPVVEKGHQLQAEFFHLLFAHTDQQTQEAFQRTLMIISQNLDALLEGESTR